MPSSTSSRRRAWRIDGRITAAHATSRRRFVVPPHCWSTVRSERRPATRRTAVAGAARSDRARRAGAHHHARDAGPFSVCVRWRPRGAVLQGRAIRSAISSSRSRTRGSRRLKRPKSGCFSIATTCMCRRGCTTRSRTSGSPPRCGATRTTCTTTTTSACRSTGSTIGGTATGLPSIRSAGCSTGQSRTSGRTTTGTVCGT